MPAAQRLTIRRNVVRHNAAFGLHLYSALSASLVANNVCYGNRASGIIVSCPEGGGRNRILGNTVVDNGHGLTIWRGKGEIVVNNLVVAPGDPLALAEGTTETEAHHNLLLTAPRCFASGGHRVRPGIRECPEERLLAQGRKPGDRQGRSRVCLRDGLLGPPDRARPGPRPRRVRLRPFSGDRRGPSHLARRGGRTPMGPPQRRTSGPFQASPSDDYAPQRRSRTEKRPLGSQGENHDSAPSRNTPAQAGCKESSREKCQEIARSCGGCRCSARHGRCTGRVARTVYGVWHDAGRVGDHGGLLRLSHG